MALDIEVVSTPGRLWGMAGEWDEVLSTSGEDGLFLSLPWLRAWWDVFGEGRELRVFRVSEDGNTVGFAPLMCTRRGKLAKWRKLEFIGSGPTDRSGIIAQEGRQDVHRVVWDHLAETSDWDILELRDMCAGGPTETVAHGCFPQAEYATTQSPHLQLKGDYNQYFASLSRSMRSNLGRGWRRLQDEGAVYRSLRTMEEVEEATRYLKELSDARWDIANVLKVPGMVQFVTAASKAMAKENKVVFHSLEVKGVPTAISMGLEDRHRYLHYLTGFDPELSKYSPGSVLLLRIIEECYSEGKNEVDMLRGTEEYKYRFNAVDRMHVHFRAMNRGLLRSATCRLREMPLS